MPKNKNNTFYKNEAEIIFEDEENEDFNSCGFRYN
jgi:hypothetical protein